MVFEGTSIAECKTVFIVSIPNEYERKRVTCAFKFKRDFKKSFCWNLKVMMT